MVDVGEVFQSLLIVTDYLEHSDWDNHCYGIELYKECDTEGREDPIYHHINVIKEWAMLIMEHEYKTCITSENRYRCQGI